ncbi:MAG: nucleoside triphosphate pyrophosphohydrolase [Clostridia bacterium]|nr:nucleoside triphosphate pyrophosphohydrolase [Clostridia bacterium]
MEYTMDDLLNIMKRLRADDGCEWDKAQTHQSIKRSMIEEVYEAIEALDNNDDKMFANELGDVLLQVVFHSRIAEERGAFDFGDVVNEICTKLIDRHSHVFGNDKAGNEAEALKAWENNKKKEKGLKTFSDALVDVPKNFPALIRAEKVQKKAKNAGFDWENIDGAMDKVYEELDELKSASQETVSEEFGDLLFSVVNVGRFLNVDPEISLNDATNKFIDRFIKMEKLSEEKGRKLDELSLGELDDLWNEIKK